MKVTPYFTRKRTAAIRERRRKRWVETYSVLLAALGGGLEVLALILERFARPDVIDIFPPAWRPYVIGAAAAFGLAALSERQERRRDYRRYLERQAAAADREQAVASGSPLSGLTKLRRDHEAK